MQQKSAHDLAACHILMTRTAKQNALLARDIAGRGGVPMPFPCLQVEQVSDAIREGIRQISLCSDIVFTSSNAVHILNEHCELPVCLMGKRIAVVGEKTATALQALGVQPDIVANPPSQIGLTRAFEGQTPTRSVLFFRAEEGSVVLQHYFESQSIPVTLSLIYRTVCPKYSKQKLAIFRHQLATEYIDAVLLGSPKVARHYQQLVNDISLANKPVLVSISEQVTCAARDIGLKVQCTATETSFCGMLDALADLRSKSIWR